MNGELDLDHCFQTVTAVAKEAGVVSLILLFSYIQLQYAQTTTS